MRSDLVRTRQVLLLALSCDPGPIDGVDGPRTRAALAAFFGGGVVPPDADPALWAAARELDPPFVPAERFSPRLVTAPPACIAVHTIENARDAPGVALETAEWFAGCQPGYAAPNASAHYTVDGGEDGGPPPVVQCVLDAFAAWHAPGLNDVGIGIEHAGRAARTPAEWDSDYARRTLDRSARLAARLCRRYSIPAARLTASALAAGERAGICGHVDATRALCGGMGHTDPGEAFPWDAYLRTVRALL